MYEKNIKKLPDAYYKGKDGNNYKLLRLNELSAETFFNDMQDVLNTLDLEQAYGKTLDLYGNMLQVLRGRMTDEQYRVSIKNKIGENLCQSDTNSVLYYLSQTFNCSLSDISIDDVRVNKVNVKVPLAKNFTVDYILSMISRLLPITVTLSDIELTGTFEFGGISQGMTYNILSTLTYNEFQKITYEVVETYVCEYDKDKGFGNIEQTIGGFLGLLKQGG
jgi:hypothetical protein